jgi:hypothetical protein
MTNSDLSCQADIGSIVADVGQRVYVCCELWRSVVLLYHRFWKLVFHVLHTVYTVFKLVSGH